MNGGCSGKKKKVLWDLTNVYTYSTMSCDSWFSTGRDQGIAGGRGLGGVCDHIKIDPQE